MRRRFLSTPAHQWVISVLLVALGARALVPVGRRAWALAVSADGSRLFVAGGLSNDLTAIDTLSAKALRTIPVGQVPNAVLVDD